MSSRTFTRKHWILVILALVFMNILCWGCTLLMYGA
jgi:hypothetical protein